MIRDNSSLQYNRDLLQFINDIISKNNITKSTLDDLVTIYLYNAVQLNTMSMNLQIAAYHLGKLWDSYNEISKAD